jgi:hypothetical protein
MPRKVAEYPEPTLASYIVKLAQLGRYLVRSGYPLPGDTAIWKGLSLQTNIEMAS